jgi:SAM-dependent methyltransferase
MPHEKFDVSKLERLNDPTRFETLPPERLWEAAGVDEPAVIVELGAGTGLYACRFAELAPEAEVYAVDTEPTMVRWMIEHRPAALRGRLHPLQSAETAVPLPTGDADLVTMLNVHHELADPRSTYREVLRLTRIGGTVLVADWAPDDTDGGPPQAVRVAPDKLVALLREVGFEDVTLHEGLPRHTVVTGRKPVVCAL